jgi:pyruvate/2-oxoglutarate dehydrogenase complex dihydrolipoamide acyltransferase (E2) component
MEHSVSAPVDGVVAEMTAAAGQQVALDEIRAVITPDGADGVKHRARAPERQVHMTDRLTSNSCRARSARTRSECLDRSRPVRERICSSR